MNQSELVADGLAGMREAIQFPGLSRSTINGLIEDDQRQPDDDRQVEGGSDVTIRSLTIVDMEKKALVLSQLLTILKRLQARAAGGKGGF